MTTCFPLKLATIKSVQEYTQVWLKRDSYNGRLASTPLIQRVTRRTFKGEIFQKYVAKMKRISCVVWKLFFKSYSFIGIKQMGAKAPKFFVDVNFP